MFGIINILLFIVKQTECFNEIVFEQMNFVSEFLVNLLDLYFFTKKVIYLK